MKRRTGIALAVAALIGTTGGVVFAVTGDRMPTSGSSPGPTAVSMTDSSGSAPTDDKPTSGNSSSSTSSAPSKTAFGAGVAEENAPLLYVADDEIHDGRRVLPITDIDGLRVISVDRLDGGYLVGTSGYGDQENANLHIVDADGSTRHLARTTYSYDINLAKDRVVAIDYLTKRAVVWSNDGKIIGRTKPAAGNMKLANVGFVEGQVAVSSTDFDADPISILWDPVSSKVIQVKPSQLSSLGVSPGGSFMAGNDADGCLGLTSDTRIDNFHQWSACDWRSFGVQSQFSPDGSKVLAVPGLTDGFGPGELAAFGVKEGPKKPVGDFKTPNLTTDARWADSSHVWVTGARGGNTEFKKGAWIKKCDFDGRCETVVTTDKGEVVLGGGVY